MFDYEALDEVWQEPRPDGPAGALEKGNGKEFNEELSRRRATVDEEGETFESTPQSPVADFREGLPAEVVHSGEYESINATPGVVAQAELEARQNTEEAQLQAEVEARQQAEHEEARQQAELEARQKAEEAQLQAEVEALQKVEQEEARMRAESEASLKAEDTQFLQAEAEARQHVELEETRLQAESEARQKSEEAKFQVEAEARQKMEQEEARLQAESEACQKAEEAQLQAEAAENRVEERAAVEEVDAAAAENSEVEMGTGEEAEILEELQAAEEEADAAAAENREVAVGTGEEAEVVEEVEAEEEEEEEEDEATDAEGAEEEADAAAAENREVAVGTGEEAEVVEEVEAEEEEEEEEDDMPPLVPLQERQVQSDIFIDDVIVETAENAESDESDEMPPLQQTCVPPPQQISDVPKWSSRRRVQVRLIKTRADDERAKRQEMAEVKEDLPQLEAHDEPEAFEDKASRWSRNRSGSRHKRESRGGRPQDGTMKKDEPPLITKAHAKLPWTPKPDQVVQPRAYAWSVFRPRPDGDEASISSQGASSSSVVPQHLQRNHNKGKTDVSTKRGQTGKYGSAMAPQRELPSKGGKGGKYARAKSGSRSPARRRGVHLQSEQQPLSHAHTIERTSSEMSWKPSLFAERRPTVRESFEVPPSMTGRIIGKGGKMIQQLQSDSGAKIQIDKECPGTVRVHLSGSSEAMALAKRLILDMQEANGRSKEAPQRQARSKEIMEVPASSTRRITGRGGETVSQQREFAAYHQGHAANKSQLPIGAPREVAQELNGYHKEQVAYRQGHAANNSQLPVRRPSEVPRDVAQDLQGRKLRVWRPSKNTPPTTSYNFAPAQRTSTSRRLLESHGQHAMRPEDISDVESLGSESNSCEEIEAEDPPPPPPPSDRNPVRRLQGQRPQPEAEAPPSIVRNPVRRLQGQRPQPKQLARGLHRLHQSSETL